MMLPERAIKLSTPAGFVDIWWEKKRDGAPGPYAYELTEREHEEYYGRRRYSDYGSFYRTMYNRTMKGHANKTARL